MHTRDIPMNEWRSFLGRFSHLHEGALVTMNVSAPDVGEIDAVIDQPLGGIDTEGDELLVHVGKAADDPHLTHRILHVDSVRLEQTDEGADVALDINGIDGIRTIVRFRSPMREDLLDRGVE